MSTTKKSPKKSVKKPLDMKIEYIIAPSRVQAKRMEMSLSQIEVSKMLGLTRIHYGNIEKGLVQAREVVAEKISKALKSSVKKLFTKLENGKYISER